MSNRSRHCHAFSLVEVTLALGVASFCLTAVLGLLPLGFKTQQTSISQTMANSITSEIIGDLRSAVRARPPAQNSKQFSIGLPSSNGSPWNPVPTTLYFSRDGIQQNGVAGSVFAANIVYTSSTSTTALVDITVSWPATQTDPTKVAGAAETLAVVNRAVP
jgi:type II secretory pathway pseudopilin PulG